MTYKSFLQSYRRYRERITPDIRERLPKAPESEGTPVPPVRWSPYRLVAAAMAVLLVVSSVCIGVVRGFHPTPSATPGNGTTSPPSSTPTTSPSEILTGVGKIPAWYAPGELEIFTIQEEELELAEFDGRAGTKFLDLTGRYNHPDHQGCSGLYYDIRTQKVVCITHMLREVLARDGWKNTDTYVHFFEPKLGKVLFTAKGQKGNPSYCYDLATSTYQKLSVSLYQSMGHAGGFEERLPGTPYYVTMVPRKGDEVGDDILLIHLETAQVTNILKDQQGRYLWKAMDDARLSRGGQYVLYTKITGDGVVDNGPGRTNIIYHIATGESREFQGYILHQLPDDSRLVVESPEGIYVYTCATGEKQPLQETADLPAQYRFQIGVGERYTDDCAKLVVHNLLTGEAQPVSDKYIHAYAISKDYRYLYYYVRGEEALTCREIATGNAFGLPVDKAFVQATQQGSLQDKEVLFDAWFDEEDNTLYLSFQRTEKPLQDPEKVREEREKDPRYLYSQLVRQGAHTCISEMSSLFEKFPAGIKAYAGDGFLFVEYAGVFGFEQDLQVIFEDYRSNRGYALYHRGQDFASDFSMSRESRSLPPNEREKVRELLDRLQIPVEPAPIDYGQYIKNGELDEMAVKRRAISSERIMNLLVGYFVKSKQYSGAAQGLESWEDLKAMQDFLQFTEKLNFRLIDGEKQIPYHNRADYAVNLYCGDRDGMEQLYFGKKDGRPFILFYGMLAEFRQEDYARWSGWLEQQSEKCKLP